VVRTRSAWLLQFDLDRDMSRAGCLIQQSCAIVWRAGRSFPAAEFSDRFYETRLESCTVDRVHRRRPLRGQSARADVPENLRRQGVPPIMPRCAPMWDVIWSFRSAAFSSWHPQRREMLISTRFANTPQLHLLKFPGGARRQLTFLPEPVTGGSFRPKTGEIIVFSQDIGGGEF